MVLLEDVINHVLEESILKLAKSLKHTHRVYYFTSKHEIENNKIDRIKLNEYSSIIDL